MLLRDADHRERSVLNWVECFKQDGALAVLPYERLPYGRVVLWSDLDYAIVWFSRLDQEVKFTHHIFGEGSGPNMDFIILQILARTIAEWRGSDAYDEIIETLATAIKTALPSHAIEPQIGQVFTDLGSRLQEP